MLIDGVKKLEKAGASFIAIPCNTVNYFIKEMRSAVQIPILSLPELVKEKYNQKLGLLGTETTTPRTKNDDWLPTVNNLLNNYFPYRSDIVLQQLKDKGWYPDVEAPIFNEQGGYFVDNVTIAINAKGQPGRIYYTTNGSDPRQPGGEVSSTALLYKYAFQLTESCTVQARVLFESQEHIERFQQQVGPTAWA